MPGSLTFHGLLCAQEAVTKFQYLQKVYTILGDPDK